MFHKRIALLCEVRLVGGVGVVEESLARDLLSPVPPVVTADAMQTSPGQD